MSVVGTTVLMCSGRRYTRYVQFVW